MLSRRDFVVLAALAFPMGCRPAREAVREERPEEQAEPTRRAAEVERVSPQVPEEMPESNGIIKPPRLQEGATIGLVSPGGVIARASDVTEVRETLKRFGLRSVVGAHALDRRGYLAGTDADRAADLNRMFEDPRVDAILTLRGGWGCNRILPLLDYELIRQQPKILMGYSDITSLLIALYAQSGLVTFHGPVGISTWNDFSVDYVRRILFDGESVRLRNPRPIGPPSVRARDRIHTIRAGKARGRLVGGNLSVLVSMLGSPYVPDFEDHILFLEDVREDIYRVDRMLTQLSLAGVLQKLSGIVFGKCTRCEDGDEDPDQTLSLQQVLEDHFSPLGIPCWYGAMIGHIEDKFTVPLGVEAEIDAGTGTIRLLEPAVL